MIVGWEMLDFRNDVQIMNPNAINYNQIQKTDFKQMYDMTLGAYKVKVARFVGGLEFIKSFYDGINWGSAGNLSNFFSYNNFVTFGKDLGNNV